MKTIDELLEIQKVIAELNDQERRELVNISKGHCTNYIIRADLMTKGLVAFNHEMTAAVLTSLGIAILTAPLIEII